MRLWDLAQVNIAKLRAPLDSPELADFVDALDHYNAVAEASPGFVWRLQDASGNATAIRGPWTDDVMVNMSTWESVATLEAYVYETGHAKMLARRKEFFRPLGGRHLALWWVPTSHKPTLAEAADRLDLLHRSGPTAQAFTMRRPFDAPSHHARAEG